MSTAALRRALAGVVHSSDAQLLRRFATDRCDEAFAALVSRYGPLVLGVCRRVVPDRDLADDAFQAAFVVLARRAERIDPDRPLGPWLYAVAHRVALRARTMTYRRLKREVLTATVPDTYRAAPVVDDAPTVLDEEIGKLSDPIRDAVILCELQGLSRRAAAAQLGITEGTLSSRLASARKTLAARLRARGVVLSGALSTAAVLPSDLIAAAVRAGTRGAFSSVVASLADGVSTVARLQQFKLVGAVVVCAGLVAGGFGPWPSSPAGATPVPREKPNDGSRAADRSAARKANAPAPKPKPRDGVIVIVPGYPRTPARLLTPDGTVTGELPFDDVFSCALSPDGAQMAAVVRERPDATPGKVSHAVHVVSIDADRKKVGEPLATGLSFPIVAWAADGKSLYVSDFRVPEQPGTTFRPDGVKVYDPVKRTATAVPGLQACSVTQVSPDGKRLLARRFVAEPTERVETVVLDATSHKPVDVGAKGVTLIRFFGANRMLGVRAKPKGAPNEQEHVIFDLAAKKSSPVPLPKAISGATAGLVGVLPSPDGQRVLYFWSKEVPAPADWPVGGGACRVARMGTSDLDGGNARTIFKPEILEQKDTVRNHIYLVDWR